MSSFRTKRRAGRTGLAIGTVPWFVQELGLALIAVGALIDGAYHVWWSSDARRAGLGLLGHVVTLVGMVVTMVVVVTAGLRSSANRPTKGEQHAGRRASTS